MSSASSVNLTQVGRHLKTQQVRTNLYSKRAGNKTGGGLIENGIATSFWKNDL
jgi:hypothetical protein